MRDQARDQARDHSNKRKEPSSTKILGNTDETTTSLVNFTSTFIMQNVNPKLELFFTLDCNGYKRWLEQLLSQKLKRDDHQRIRERFPWNYHKTNLLKTECICIPLRVGDYHSVMFVMNVNSVTNMNTNKMDSDGIYEDDKVPVIYHFDSSPNRESSEANNSPLKFVYSFLNWLVTKKKNGKTVTDTTKPSDIFNSQNLPICVIRLKQPIKSWISGYNVIKYICVMYNQVIYN